MHAQVGTALWELTSRVAHDNSLFNAQRVQKPHCKPRRALASATTKCQQRVSSPTHVSSMACSPKLHNYILL